MGCDMHFTIEGKGTDGTWYRHKFDCLFFREYSIFSLMAGVRKIEGCEPLFEPRGVPDDASPGTVREIKSWVGSNAHSHSWLTLDELKKVNAVHKERCDPFLRGRLFSILGEISLDGIIMFMDAFTRETRIVFWFDC